MVVDCLEDAHGGEDVAGDEDEAASDVGGSSDAGAECTEYKVERDGPDAQGEEQSGRSLDVAVGSVGGGGSPEQGHAEEGTPTRATY